MNHCSQSIEKVWPTRFFFNTDDRSSWRKTNRMRLPRTGSPYLFCSSATVKTLCVYTRINGFVMLRGNGALSCELLTHYTVLNTWNTYTRQRIWYGIRSNSPVDGCLTAVTPKNWSSINTHILFIAHGLQVTRSCGHRLPVWSLVVNIKITIYTVSVIFSGYFLI